MKIKLLLKIILVFTVFLFQFHATAQLFVSPNSYDFSNHEMVRGKQNLELQAAERTFYLRDNVQLLQGPIVTSSNSGLENVSTVQQRSTNNFYYKYCCSFIGKNSASVSNSQLGSTQFKDVSGLITRNEPLILSNNYYNGTSNPLAIAPLKVNTTMNQTQFISGFDYTTVNLTLLPLITFKTENLLDIQEATPKSFLVFQDNSAKILVINNPFLNGINFCGFYDVTGKQIFIKNDLGTASTYQFSTASLSNGIYIVKIITNQKKSFGKKIIVKN